MVELSPHCKLFFQGRDVTGYMVTSRYAKVLPEQGEEVSALLL